MMHRMSPRRAGHASRPRFGSFVVILVALVVVGGAAAVLAVSVFARDGDNQDVADPSRPPLSLSTTPSATAS